jgi:gliding motility-associated-like protein
MTVTGFVATDKAYDATRTATVTFSSLTYDGLVFGDTVSAASAGGLFDTKEVGTNKRVDITATYAGSDTNNYNIQTQPSTTASITGKVAYLTGASGVNKVYDDNNSLPSGVSGYGLLTGVVAGDNVTVNGIAAYDSKNAGSRTIVQGGVTLIGTDATNYSLNWTNGSGTISTRTLTVTARDDAKFVTQTDVVGFKGAAVVGFISDDNIAADLTGTLSIARTNAGTETAGTYTNVLSPSGYSAVNYTISYVPGDFTIVAADELLVTVSNTTMVYGNTPNYTILSGKYYSSTSSTVVTLALPSYSDGTYTFNDGVGGTARFGLSLSPDTKSTANFYKVGAYSVAAIDIVETSVNFSNRITVVGALEVTPKSVTASPSTVVKNYDGTTTMTGMSLSLSGILSGDLVSSLGSGYFSNAQSGIGKTYFLSGLSLSGTDASNYVLTNAGTYSDTSGIINKIPLQIKANDATKVYDGNPYSGGNGVVYSGFITGEGIAQLSGALSYSGSSQGAIASGTYVIQPGGFTADNYTLSYVNGSLIIEAGDTDGDGILDINDNCPTVANVDQADLDADGLGDVCDADKDGDGFSNTYEIACGTDPMDALSFPSDIDADGIPDCVDPDRDGDGILDVNDNCVTTPNTDQADYDSDGLGDVCDSDIDGDGFSNETEVSCGTNPLDFNDFPIDTDGDGLANCEDLDDDNDGQSDEDETACGSDTLDASSLAPDYDSDGIPDCVDPDSDNDGCLNEADAFPLDETECVDTDGDGSGNNADPDDDNDGQTDVTENQCGSDSLDALDRSIDTDSDGIPDCLDPDDDNDGQSDLHEEACGSDPIDAASLSPDFDSDGIPDCLDPDDDNDGCLDLSDAFPLDASECLDTDQDGLGNNKDTDDDNDGQLDTHEEDCGSDALDYNSLSLDYDADGIPDCIDSDIDGDGCLNYEDAFPYNPLECVDTDGDGLGDNEDLDDNNDGCEDTDLCISELITPNESGIESVWLIQNITQYPNAYVRVFDRHRQLVFEQQGYKSDWDGKYQKSKKPLPAGPYYYIVQLNDGSAARTGWLYITY